MALDSKELALLAQIENWLDEHEDRMIDGILRLLRIDSVSGEADGPYPYGKGCGDALDEAGRLAEELGFSLENDAYQYGLVHLEGKGDRSIGLFNHLDVVPPGEGWIYEPFQPFVRDGHIFGRGSADNKGGAVASLLILKCLRDLGIRLEHTVTLYLGCHEESGMQDLEYYLTRHSPPDYSLTPDASYPVCRGEKTRILADLSAELEDPLILQFEGGKFNGAVPNQASMLLAGVDEAALRAILPEEIEVSRAEEGVLLEARGIAAHGGTPEGSLNAVGVLAGGAAEIPELSEKTRGTLRSVARILGDYYGEGPGIACEDFSGKLTHVGGITRLSEGKLAFPLNIKCPLGDSPERILALLTQNCLADGFSVSNVDVSPGYCLDDQDPVIQALNDVCNCIWETDRPPFILGGGTYARKLPHSRALAFGCSLPGVPRPVPPGHGFGHQPDECVSIDALRRSIQIYVLSLLRMEGLLPG